jgi:hypothetical protein
VLIGYCIISAYRVVIGWVSSSCSTFGNRRVTLVTNPTSWTIGTRLIMYRVYERKSRNIFLICFDLFNCIAGKDNSVSWLQKYNTFSLKPHDQWSSYVIQVSNRSNTKQKEIFSESTRQILNKCEWCMACPLQNRTFCSDLRTNMQRQFTFLICQITKSVESE